MADERVEPPNDGTNLGNEGGESCRLLSCRHLDRRDVIMEGDVWHHLRVDMRIGHSVRLALIPLELPRPVLVIIGLVEICLIKLAANAVPLEGHHLEVVL